MTMEWGNDLVMQFIELYKSEPVLWSQDSFKNRDRQAVNAAWERIGKAMNIEVADLKRKKDSIKASYRSLLRKKKECSKSGVPYRPVWFAYDALDSFLNKNHQNEMEVPDMSLSLDTDGDTTPETEQEVEYLQVSEFEDDNEVHDDPIKEEVQPTIKSRQTRLQKYHRLTARRPHSRRNGETSSSTSELRILSALKSLKKTEVPRKKDECESFGEYIAESLRKHDERTQCMIKQAINNILFEQEMKKYNSEHYVVISNVDNALILGDQDEK